LTSSLTVTKVGVVSDDLRALSDPARVLVRRRAVDQMRVCTAICR